MTFDPTLFARGADVRGTYPEQINADLAWLTGVYLARAVAKITGGDEPKIIVGRDGRVSSPEIYAALVAGIAAGGGEALPCDLATTDMVQWGVGEQLGGAVAGAMITASHNPPQYNGIKMVVHNPASGDLDMLRPVEHLNPQFQARADGEDVPPGGDAPPPADAGLDLQGKFVAAAMKRSARVAQASGKIVLDPGNGVGALFRPLLEREFAASGAAVEILEIAGEIDGTFPSRPSNPGLPGAVKALQAKVVESGAAFGAAFDGDADRVFLVDERGEFVSGSVLLAALSKRAVEKARAEGKADPAIVYAAVSSWLVPQTVRAAGGVPVISRVGQDSIKVALARTKAVFGGESSAHYNYPDTYCLDSGLFSLIDFWDLLLESGMTCSALLASLNPWPHSGEVNLRLENCADWKALSQDVIATLAAEFGSEAADCYVLQIDGVTACHPRSPQFADADALFAMDAMGDPEGKIYRLVGDYAPDWWLNVRASNNEPLLRLNVETRDPANVQAQTKGLIARIRQLCDGKAAIKVEDRGNLEGDI